MCFYFSTTSQSRGRRQRDECNLGWKFGYCRQRGEHGKCCLNGLLNAECTDAPLQEIYDRIRIAVIKLIAISFMWQPAMTQPNAVKYCNLQLLQVQSWSQRCLFISRTLSKLNHIICYVFF